jgi:shikimate dehydrogenase
LLRSGSEGVRITGAANALRPCVDGWEGDLFDGEGFAIGIEARGFHLGGKNCAVIGAGGAGAAIALALLERRVGSLSIWDVDHRKAAFLVERLSAISPVPVAVGEPGKDTDLAVNATPLGMSPDDPLPMAIDSLRTDALVAEAIMKPPMTRLLIEARRRGCEIQQGRHMLDNQVAAIWKFFELP